MELDIYHDVDYNRSVSPSDFYYPLDGGYHVDPVDGSTPVVSQHPIVHDHARYEDCCEDRGQYNHI